MSYLTEFAITPAAEVDFDLGNASPASGALRKRRQDVVPRLRAECGSAFLADPVAHKGDNGSLEYV